MHDGMRKVSTGQQAVLSAQLCKAQGLAYSPQMVRALTCQQQDDHGAGRRCAAAVVVAEPSNK